MQLRPFSLKHLLLKLVIYAAIFYVVVIAISILITGFLFVSLGAYKNRIEGVVFKQTGYQLTVNSIKTKLNSYYLPEIIIQDLKLTNPSNAAQTFRIKYLDLVFSYSSIWHLEPIFNQITLDGTSIKVEYLANGSIIVNGININHPDQKTIESSQESPIDIEKWLLNQGTVKLTNANLSFIDKKNNLPPLQLNPITVTLTNGLRNKHDLSVNIGSGDKPNLVGADLSWQGNKFSQMEKWQQAELKVQTYNNKDPITGILEQYIPGANLLHKFTAETVLDAQVKDGKLQFLYANFDIKNFQYALKHNTSFISFPQFGGSIQVTLVNNDHYQFRVNNLTLATPNGYVFNNKNISGSYHLNQYGSISITDTDLSSFDNLLAMLPINNISLAGNLEIIKLEWLGSLFHPTNYTLYTKFTNLAILSKNSNLPSLNNLTGNLTATKSGGVLNLTLKDSTLKYSKAFLMPYYFKSLTSQISWKYNNDNTLDVVLHPTTIETADFKASASGKYIYKPGTSGYLDLAAHVDKVLISKIRNYLPRVIGKDVHEWLNMALLSGYAINGNLELKGWLDDFPYDNGKGKFYITTTVNKAKLRYIKDWPSLDNINGTFAIRNQKILVQANSGNIAGNEVNRATVIIPNMISSQAHLIVDGVASGSTTNFMRYIQQTPINEIIGRIPDQVRAKGNGEVNLHLKLPFAKPEHTQVSGSYNFINNEIKFDLPVPLLRGVIGKLFFTDHGVKIEKIEAKTLNSMTILSATTAKNGIMHFKINSPALDYNAASSFYLPFLAPLISGKSATNIYFNIGKHGLDQLGVSSTLQGVKLDAPAPLAKEFTDISKMNLTMLNKKANFAISFDYANRLFGNLSLNQHGQINQGQLALGTKEFATTNPNKSKLVINANLDEMHIFTWLETIKKLTATNSTSETTTFTNSITKKPQPTITATQPLAATNTESATIFPLEILLNTNNLYVEQQNFHKANADLLVTRDRTLFNFNNTQANGFGSYTYANQQLDLFLNKFNLQHSIENNLPKVTVQQQQLTSVANFKSSVTPTESIVINHTQDLAVNLVKPAIESAVKVTAASFNSAPMGQPNSQKLNFPTINLLINNLYYENHSLGKFSVRLRPVGPDLLIEDGELTNENTARIVFSGGNYCMECGSKKALVNLTASVKINDLGALLENLDYGQIIAKAKGEGSVSVQWNGQLQDFDFAHAIAEVSINLTSGKFLKVDTNNIIGRIIGLINLQTLVSFAKLEFAEIFANGFYFDQLNLKAYFLNNKINLKNLTMSGPLANVHSLGSIDIPNDNLNLYLSVTPRLGTSLAIGAAIATANPIVGLAAFAAQWLLGEPINKLFTFSYHITGSLSEPDINQIGVTKQIIRNVSSAIGS